jgi:hypothetical protein
MNGGSNVYKRPRQVANFESPNPDMGRVKPINRQKDIRIRLLQAITATKESD